MRAERGRRSGAGVRFLAVLIAFVAGVLTAAQPYLGIYEGAPEEFLRWLRAIGMILILHSILLLVAYFLDLGDQVEALAINVLFNCIYLFMAFKLFNNPDIVPLVSYRDEQLILLEDSEFKDSVVKILLGSLMALLAVSIVHSLKLFLFPVKPRRRGPNPAGEA